MKRKFLSLLLALTLVLTMVPALAHAAEADLALHAGLSSENAVPGLVCRSPETPATNAHDMNNEVNIYYTEGGTVTAERRDVDDWDTYAVITAIPDEGYVLYGLVVENANGEDSNIIYKGSHVFDVELIYDTTTNIYIYFARPEGELHNIYVEVSEPSGGTYTITKTQAYAGEQIFVDLDFNEKEHYSRAYVDFTAGLYHPVRDCEISNDRFEMLMPDSDVWVSIRFLQDQPISISSYSYGGGSIDVDIDRGWPGDVFYCTIKPYEGYRLNYIYSADGLGTLPLTYVGDNRWKGVIREDANHVGIDVTFVESGNPFLDVPETEFYYEPVLWALENGVTTGADLSHFNPNGQCLRAQVVTFLWRAEGCPEPETAINPFVDVKESDFYYKAVLWAVENGITNGADATHFNPMGVCNRAQVVTFLHRAKGSPAPESMDLPFTDVPGDIWYAAPVAWALENGVTHGMTATEFAPDSACNRAQVVTFLYRAKDIAKAEPRTAHTFELRSNDPTEETGFVFCEGSEFAAGESVIFYAEPWYGYLVEFEAEPNVELELYYLGAFTYELIMPDHDVVLTANFVPAPGEHHFINTTCENGEFYAVCDFDEDLRDIAKAGEFVQFYVMPDEGCTLEPQNITLTVNGEAWDSWWYLGELVEEYEDMVIDGIFVFETVMPDADLDVSITCTPGTAPAAADIRVPVTVR